MEEFSIKIAINFLYLPFVSVLMYLNLDREVIFIFSILLFLDVLTGLGKTIRVKGKPKSRYLSRGILSKMILILVPFTIALTAKAIKLDIHVLVLTILNILILSEAYSITANIYTIRTGREVEEFDVVSIILKKIRDMLTKIIGEEDGK